MLKFIKAILIVVCLFIVSDIVFGRVMDNLITKLTDSRGTSLTQYIYTKVEAPIIVAGASRANHHYAPKILEDSLGFRAYNAGRDDQKLLYCSCIIDAILSRTPPKLIIWEFNPPDIFDPKSPTKLKPYYYQDSLIKSSIDYCDGEVKTRLLMNSSLFRYNEIGPKIIPAVISSSSSEVKSDGYLPLPYDENQSRLELILSSNTPKKDVDPFLRSRFERVVKRTKSLNVKIIVVISPTLNPYGEEYIKPTRILCDKLDIPFIDNSLLEPIVTRPELFKDHTHLTYLGAEEYTRIFTQQIKDII